MKKFLIFFLPVIFLSGCSYKHDDLYTSAKKTTEQAVSNTKKTQILKENKPIIFVTVTYLDSLNNKKFVNPNLEQFVVGIHFTNINISKKEQEKTLREVTFKINNSKEHLQIQTLNPQSPILNIIPASTPWSHYFLVETKKIPKNNIKFTL